MTDPATPSRSHRAGPPITLNWRHITVALMLLVDAIYVAVIASGVVHADGAYVIPAQINQMVVATLGVATLTAVTLVITGRLTNRIDDAVVVLSATITQVRDDPTVRLTRPSVPPQHVIGIASPALYGQRAEAALDRAAARLWERFEEHGNQRYYEGYAHRVEDDAGGATVTALAPRNGHRSTS